MKKDFVMPIFVLTLICIIVSGSLAAVNGVTQPIIQEASSRRVYELIMDILPHAEELVRVEAEGLPGYVTGVYATSNDVGHIFLTSVNGYNPNMRIVCVIGPDGTIIRTQVIEHTETQGIGNRVFDRQGLYIGKDRHLEGISSVSGATITHNAYKRAVLASFEAFDIVTSSERGGE